MSMSIYRKRRIEYIALPDPSSVNREKNYSTIVYMWGVWGMGWWRRYLENEPMVQKKACLFRDCEILLATEVKQINLGSAKRCCITRGVVC